jgi:hypothetical protein
MISKVAHLTEIARLCGSEVETILPYIQAISCLVRVIRVLFIFQIQRYNFFFYRDVGSSKVNIVVPQHMKKQREILYFYGFIVTNGW